MTRHAQIDVKPSKTTGSKSKTKASDTEATPRKAKKAESKDKATKPTVATVKDKTIVKLKKSASVKAKVPRKTPDKGKKAVATPSNPTASSKETKTEQKEDKKRKRETEDGAGAGEAQGKDADNKAKKRPAKRISEEKLAAMRKILPSATVYNGDDDNIAAQYRAQRSLNTYHSDAMGHLSYSERRPYMNIAKEQMKDNSAVPRAPINRLVRGIMHDRALLGFVNSDSAVTRITGKALDILRFAAEAVITDVMRGSVAATAHRKRFTTTDADMRLVLKTNDSLRPLLYGIMADKLEKGEKVIQYM